MGAPPWCAGCSTSSTSWWTSRTRPPTPRPRSRSMARAPLLPIGLLNGGADGGGMVPPHNLSELWTALEHVRQDPDESLDDLMEVLPGPDFSTGGGAWGPDAVRALHAPRAAAPG